MVDKGTIHIGFSKGDDNAQMFEMQFVEEDLPCCEPCCAHTKSVFGVKGDLGEGHRCNLCDWLYGRLWEREW